jgi:hypothetical protein
MLTRIVSRRLRRWLIGAALVGLFWIWMVYARSRSVHVSDVRGSLDGDRYTVTCRIDNPTAADVQLTAAISVYYVGDSDEGTTYGPLASAERELIVPAQGLRNIEVHFEPTWNSWCSVHPQVLLRNATGNP